MKKSLIERLATSNQIQHKTPVTKNKVAFFVLRDDIAEALEKGWSMIAIWQTLKDEGKITTSYNTFRLHIAKFINGQTTTPKQTKSAFTYNPKANISALI